MKIESNNFGIREQLLKFDEVNNEQREVIYAERRKVLDGDNMRDLVLKMITDTVENAVDISVSDDQTPDKWDLQELNNLLLPVIPLKPVTLSDEQKKSMKKNELKHNLKEEAIKLYETNGWRIWTIWTHCVRVSAFRHTARGIRWLNIRCRVTRCTNP